MKRCVELALAVVSPDGEDKPRQFLDPTYSFAGSRRCDRKLGYPACVDTMVYKGHCSLLPGFTEISCNATASS